jgi:hypothetical protein
MALEANERTGSTRADFLEIQARAHAALREHGEAVRAIERALDLPGTAGDAALTSRLRALRAEYSERAGG